ncbi:hypothetical protein ECFDA504_2015, partial [Escherichia coli FDA504]
RKSLHQQNDAVLTVLNIHAVTSGFIRIFRGHRVHHHRAAGSSGLQHNGAVLYWFSCAIFKHARNFYCHTFPPIKKARSSDATGFRTV